MNSKLNTLLNRAQLRLVDGLASVVGANQDFERFFAFEQKYGFPYTRLKGRSKLGYTPDLKTPRSFNEKSIHRRLFSRDPIWPVITHKVAVRQWLKEHYQENDLDFTTLLHIVDDPDTFELEKIDEPVIIKAAWASGLNRVVNDPQRENWNAVRSTLKHWQTMPYFPKRLVWAETRMERQFVIERLHSSNAGELLDDYKFYVFHGQVEMLQAIADRSSGINFGLYDRNLKPLTVSRTGKKIHTAPIDSSISDMIPVAERIGQQLDFARIDLYRVQDKILFGEITPCPVNGYAAFTPTRFDFELGEKWVYDHAHVYDAFLNLSAPLVDPATS